MKRKTKVKEETSGLNDLRAALEMTLIEREDEINTVLLGLVAREHVLFVGPPGTAKSQLITSVTRAIDGARSFSQLLTKFTTPEELFGPVKLSALREDRYERAIDGYAPSAHLLFIDEIWKASSAILNTILTLLQERVFDNGGSRVQCPLRLAIAASNEWPSAEEGQELGAIFDRFLIRHVVRPVSVQGRERLLYDLLPAIKPGFVAMSVIDDAADTAARLPIADATKGVLSGIFAALNAEGIRPGDRRARKCIGIARAAAYLDGAAEVKPIHLESLKDVLWAAPEQRDKCAEIIVRMANPVGAKLADLLREVDEILGTIVDSATRMAAIKKLEDCETTAKELAGEANGRAKKTVQFIRRHRTEQTSIALGMNKGALDSFDEDEEGY